MKVFCDLHIHSSFAGGTSRQIDIDKLTRSAKKKGLTIIGSGDILFPIWRRKLLESCEKIDDGTLFKNDVYIVPQVEVEDKDRVHHVILFNSFSDVESFYEMIRPRSKNIDREGRPKVFLSGDEIVELARDVDACIGPAHAFTPWTSLYKSFDSLSECYKDQVKNIDFIELGLSADTYFADRIKELHDYVFLSNSDAHSHYLNRIGREGNLIELEEPTAESLIKAIKAKKVLLNYGLDPREGKYHRSACIGCGTKFKLEDAKSLGWRCPLCGKVIKKGVHDRIEELADYDEPRSPKFRPRYFRLIPLIEIIQLIKGYSSPYTKSVMTEYESYISKYGSELDILLFKDMAELHDIDPRILDVIKALREGKIDYIEGGGGVYGKPKIGKFSELDDNKWYVKKTSKNLFDFI